MAVPGKCACAANRLEVSQQWSMTDLQAKKTYRETWFSYRFGMKRDAGPHRSALREGQKGGKKPLPQSAGYVVSHAIIKAALGIASEEAQDSQELSLARDINNVSWLYIAYFFYFLPSPPFPSSPACEMPSVNAAEIMLPNVLDKELASLASS